LQNLHLSCFDKGIPGWMNTDVSPHLFIAKVPGAAWLLHKAGRLNDERYRQHRAGVFSGIRYLDLAKPFPFAPESFRNVFCAHVFEHLYREEAQRCAREVCRVLEPGGVFRVTVPDLDSAVAGYDPQQPDGFLEMIYENYHLADKNRHHWMYNERSLEGLLRTAGFGDVARCQYRRGRCPDLDRLDNRPDGTLFMEAYR